MVKRTWENLWKNKSHGYVSINFITIEVQNLKELMIMLK
jgi:hypothetical protein